MIIKNAEVFTENGIFEKKDIYILGEFFCERNDRENSLLSIQIHQDEIIDGTNCYLIPGLTDIHFHGCMGYDFCDGTQEALRVIAEYEASVGVTTIVPATMTFGEEKLMQIAKTAKIYKEQICSDTWKQKEKGAILCGINMEGPFISAKKKGAQNAEYIHQPNIAMFERLQKISGNLFKLVDIAPETEGALEFIRAKKDEVVIAIAHTDANYETAKNAIEAGVSHITHLYNGMNGIHHRNPGPIIAAADDMDCRAELICDSVHIHPAVVRNTLKMFGEDRIIFISDSIRSTGLCDGNYELGGQSVVAKGNLVVLEDGTIAGSNTNLMECMKIAVKEMKIPLEIAVKCAAVNSAKAVGIYDLYGSISVGKVANAVLLDKKDLSVKQVILKGHCLKTKNML